MSDAAKTGDGKDKPEGVLYIGIDFGTSRTSIASSNGVRETVLSYVGYPKDVVSQKLLKRDKLFGQEALDKQLALKLYRPLAEGHIKYSADGKSPEGKVYEENIKAAKDLLLYAIGLAKARKDELIYGVIGAPAQAQLKNKKAIIDACREHLDSVMICSEPFAVAYGIDRLDDVLVIDIGAGTTDLCRMHGTMPEEADQITLPNAGDWLDREIYGLLQRKCPGADFTINMVKQIKEKHSFVTEAPSRAMVEFPVNGKPTKFDVTDELKEGCRRIVPPIVEGLQKLIASFNPEFQARLRNNVLLAGGGSQIVGLDIAIEEYMNEHLGGGKVTRIEEPMYGGANGALKIAHDMPAEYWEKLK
jgi:rod shape-determining protein MreB